MTGETYKPKLSEAVDLLNKQLIAGMCKWMVDRSNPTMLVSFLDIPVDIELSKLQYKIQNEITELVQNRIVETLKENLPAEILEKLRGK